MAWRFLSHLSERERIDYLLYELPDQHAHHQDQVDEFNDHEHEHGAEREEEMTPLLETQQRPVHRLGGLRRAVSHVEVNVDEDWAIVDHESDPTPSIVGLTALEVAAIADAKKFLSQKSIQRVVNDMWNGEIVFWSSLGTHTKKKAHLYNKRSLSLP